MAAFNFNQTEEDDSTSFIDLFGGLFFILLLVVMLLSLNIGSGKTDGEKTGGRTDSNENSGGSKGKYPNGFKEELRADGFATGSAELPYALKQKLNYNYARELAKIAAELGADTLEVIGHTDESTYPEVKTAKSSTDNQIARTAGSQSGSMGTLSFSSNIELGMGRALAVYKQLAQFEHTLRPIKYFKVYSAGQYIRDNNVDLRDYSSSKLTDDTRKRIELRLVSR